MKLLSGDHPSSRRPTVRRRIGAVTTALTMAAAGVLLAPTTASAVLAPVDPVLTVALDPALPNGQNGWWTTPVGFTLTSDDPSAVLEYRTAGGEWATWSAPVVLNGGTVEYRAVVSGTPGASQTVELPVDGTAPVTTVSITGTPGAEEGEYLAPASVTFSAADPLSGVDHTEYRTGEGDWSPVEGPLEFTEAGQYPLEYRSRDLAGNVESIHALDLVVVEAADADDEFRWSTDFRTDDIGSTPAGWTSRWAGGSTLVVNDNPRRATFTMPEATGNRTLWTFDAPGVLDGDSEISAVVRVAAPLPTTKFQTHLFAQGSLAANTNESYYLDHNASSARISRGSPNAGFTALRTLSFTFNADTWYNVVFRREAPNLLYGKIWAYGAPEPAAWMMSTTSAMIESGWVGIGHNTAGAVTEYAFFGAATEGRSAPRPPAGLITAGPATPAPTGLTAADREGYVSLAWEPVEVSGTTVTYQVWRTPVDAAGNPTGSGVLVGNWQRGRTADNRTTWADSGLVEGQRYAWRVGAVVAGALGELSDPAYATARGVAAGPGGLRTGWEISGGLNWTTGSDEETYLRAVEAASPRVRVEEYGRTVQGRPMYVAVIGDPPPAAEAVADRHPALVDCSVHGNEPAGREACLMLIRRLAFSEDPAIVAMLQRSTVLVVPSMNPDGRAANTRANSAGQDLNRDHTLLEQPESLAFAQLLKAYQPISLVDGHEYGTATASDLPILWPRNPNIDDALHLEARDALTFGTVGQTAAAEGWWANPYPIGYGGEGILRNATGLKNIVGMLLESRIAAGTTRPGEGGSTSASNRQRRVYSQLFTFDNVLAHHRANLDELVELTDAAAARQAASTAPIALDGSRPSPVGSPPAEPTTRLLSPAPCGYTVTGAQWASGTPSVGVRMDAHGIISRQVTGGRVIELAQPLRGLIPLLLDPQATEPMVSGARVMSGCAGITEVVAPQPPQPATYSTRFADDTAGQAPAGWTSQWNPGETFVVNDVPRRLTHRVAVNLAREAYSFDVVGQVTGDVEVSAVVRTVLADGEALPNTKFQVHITGGGTGDTTTSYYIDHLGGNLRINRFSAGAVSNMVSVPFTYEGNTWYHVVLNKQGSLLRGKLWAYGTPEPADWMISVSNTVLNSGWVGVGHSTIAALQEFAWFSAGTYGASALRAPDDLFVTAAATETAIELTAGGHPVTAAPVGQAVQVSARVTTGSADVTSGSVEFTVDGDVIGTAPVVAGVAALTLPAPAVGAHSVGATYLPGEGLAGSVAAPAALDVHFVDVLPTATFYADITWLAEQGITTGDAAGRFEPGKAVSRQAMAAFLYRLEHGTEPAPACTVRPFTDVPVGSAFCAEIQWMKQSGLSTGYTDGSFRPANSVNRDAFAAFLYRMDGGTGTICQTAPFTDVPATGQFCAAIAWMAAEGITTGIGDGSKFGPNQPAQRQAVAAFLHRYRTQG